MDYIKIYDTIIQKAKAQKRTKYNGIYYEAHHIIPSCLGGQGKTTEWRWHSNIVLLTYKEHFICHKLLCRIYPENKKLAYALWRMCTSKSHNQKRSQSTSLTYEEARLNFIKNHPKTGTKLSTETKQRMSIAAYSRDQSKKLFGRIENETTKIKKSQAKIGSKNPNFGTTMTEDQKELRRKLILNQPSVECTHCGKVGRGPTMKKYHFSNCKLNTTT